MKPKLQSKFAEFAIKAFEASDPLPIQVQEPVNAERVIRFVASNENLDRDGEVVLLSAWNFSNWMKNPVITQFHDYSQWPIGKGIAIGVVGGDLLIDAEFDGPDVDPGADMVFRKIQNKTIRAGSVAFEVKESVTPLKRTPEADTLFSRFPQARRIYTKADLVEFTVCPIPANPSALVQNMRRSLAESFDVEPIEPAGPTFEEVQKAEVDAEVKAVMGLLDLRLRSFLCAADGEIALAGKPYPGEHAARLHNPTAYDEFRRENDAFRKGIHAIWGIKRSPRKVELQAIRFDKTLFSPDEARRWLDMHEYEPIMFEPAKGKE